MATKAFALVLILFLWDSSVVNSEDLPSFGSLVTKESRRIMVSTESGTITAVDVQDRPRGAYQLQFITMEPSSLFLPVILHADMVFFVQTGRGKVSYITGEEDSKEAATKSIDVERGDVYRLEHGTVFYVQSYPSQTREKLRIHAIFATIDQENPFEPTFGAYSNITDLVRGFDERVLQMGFGVSEEVVRDIKGGEKTPSILPYTRRNETEKLNWKEGVFEAIIGVRDPTYFVNKKKKKKKKTESKAFNFYSSKPDEENCYGWSTAVTYKDLHALRGSHIGLFMVNLTTGSMMGPHWNPKATEIAIVIHGQGMVQIVCPTDPSGQSSGTDKCQNALFRVKEGDVFIVPKFHPMAQISFNNDSFVFVGFSTNAETNHPQFLAGSRSVLQVIDRKILAMSFNAANTTVEGMLASQNDAIILSCTSCAEELERKMEEEHPEEEEARKREEEEARKRQEEARRREEEEARRRQEEEEARRRQQEEEEARRRQEKEEARRREQEEEEAARRQQEEEAKRREEEEARRKQEEEEARRREEEEEARRREEEQRRQQEEEAARQQEEEEARRREEEQEGEGEGEGGGGEQEGGGEERREWGEVVKMGVLKVPPREVLTV